MDLQRSITTRIHQVARQIDLRYADFGRDRNVSAIECHVLDLLHRNDETTSRAISTALGIKPSTMTSMLDRLEDRGLIKRVAAPDDRRTIRVRLTRRGQILAEQLHAEVRRFERKIQSMISRYELRSLWKLVHAVGLATDA